MTVSGAEAAAQARREVPPQRRDRFGGLGFVDNFYIGYFVIIGILMALSPFGARFAGVINYDRYCDGLTLLLLGVRTLEYISAKGRAGSSGFLLWSALIAYFSAASIVSYLNPQFSTALFFAEAKLLVFLVASFLFSRRRLKEAAAKKVASFILLCFVFATGSHIVLFGGERLHALNESNYTIISLFLTLIVVVKLYRLQVISIKWITLLVFAALACAVAQSRTGFVILLVYAAYYLVRERRVGLAAAVGTVALIVATAAGDVILGALSRGAIGGGVKVDRFVFLQEYLDNYVARSSFLKILFSTNVGNPLSDHVLYMGWWVNKQSAAHGVAAMLAPFNFHSALLRLSAAYGVVFAIAFYSYFVLVWRRIGLLGVGIILISSISMSTFYLSSIVPFMILALITGARE